MSKVLLNIDGMMCILWCITYTLVLIGTVKYRYPLISPMAQAVIAPFEIAVTILFLKQGGSSIHYTTIAYSYWSTIEIIIMIVMMKKGYIKEKYHILYCICVVVLVALTAICLKADISMLFLSYLYTTAGVIIWLIWVVKRKDFPIKPISVAIFIIKFIADTILIPVYYGSGALLTDLLCVGLPVVHAAFIIVFIKRYICMRKDLQTRK